MTIMVMTTIMIHKGEGMLKKSLAKDRRVTHNRDITTLTNISSIDRMVEIKVDNFFKQIENKYKIDESDIYDKLYLKVRKMFIEEED